MACFSRACRPRACSAVPPVPRESRSLSICGSLPTFARRCLLAFVHACGATRSAHTANNPNGSTRLLNAVAADPDRRFKDADLRKAGLEPARVRRYFLKHYDMTFHAYARGRRLSGAFQQLRQGAQLDEVAMGTGFESHSGFRDAFARTFGQAPGRSRGGDCVVCAWIESPLGPLVAGATTQGICLLEFTDRRMLPSADRDRSPSIRLRSGPR